MTGDDAMAVHESDVGDVRLLEVFGELDLATAPRLCSGKHRRNTGLSLLRRSRLISSVS